MQNILDDKEADKSSISFVSGAFIELLLHHFFKSTGFYILLLLSAIIRLNYDGSILMNLPAMNLAEVPAILLSVLLKFVGLFLFLLLISSLSPTVIGAYLRLLNYGLQLQLQKDKIQWIGFGSKPRKSYPIEGKIHSIFIIDENYSQSIYFKDDRKKEQLIGSFSLVFASQKIQTFLQNYYEIATENFQENESNSNPTKSKNSNTSKPDWEELEIKGYVEEFDDFDKD